MTKKLIVEPTGELANRLRVLITAHKVAAETNRELFILWKKTQKFECELADILPEEPCWTQPLPEGTKTFRASHHDGYVRQVPAHTDIEVLHVITCFPLVVGDDRYPMSVNGGWEDNLRILTQEAVRSCPLRVHPWIKDQLYSVQGIIGSIGIHIRRKNVRQLDMNAGKSPTSMFFEVVGLAFLLTTKTPIKIFLATDSTEEEELFKNEFGDHLITFPKRTTDRHVSSIAVQDAFVDILLLSMTSHIYGSYGSSFSQLASAIGNIPLHIIEDTKGL